VRAAKTQLLAKSAAATQKSIIKFLPKRIASLLG